MGLPLVVKPRGGSAGENVFVARTDDDLDLFVRYVPDPVVQELLEGPEITVDLVCAPGGRLLGLGMRRRLKVRGGEVAIGETVWDEDIAAGCHAVVAALRPDGPITIQCFLTADGPRFTEINGRFGGGVPLSFEAGMDAVLPRILAEVAGGGPTAGEPVRAATGWRMARFDRAYYDPPS